MALMQFLTDVHFGHGERARLPALLAAWGVHRPLFVTDAGVIAAGVFDKACEASPPVSPGQVFSDTPPNPTEAAAAAGAERYRQLGCDGIVGIGGGAALDLAKAVAILATHPGPLWRYCNRHPQPDPIRSPPPLCLLPTTAGTGSEVGRSAVIVFDNGIKAGIRCPSIVRAAICDPELTLKLPPVITASTGMDALAHCIETFCSPAINPPADAIALDGMRRIFANLERVVNGGSDAQTNAQARWEMMMGSLEGAIAFQKGLGAVHALSHPLGAMGFHHGTLNAILLPHVLRANARALGPAKQAQIVAAAGWPHGGDPAGGLAALLDRLPLPVRLREIGVAHEALATVSAAALEDNAHKTNPALLSRAEYAQILSAAY
jgi:4-hydroxybutyrate dehydrogenase